MREVETQLTNERDATGENKTKHIEYGDTGLFKIKEETWRERHDNTSLTIWNTQT